MINKDFWKDKKVLITGHTGFKGAWLTLWMINLGAEVYGYSLEPQNPKDLFNSLNQKLNNKFISKFGNILNKEYVLIQHYPMPGRSWQLNFSKQLN